MSVCRAGFVFGGACMTSAFYPPLMQVRSLDLKILVRDPSPPKNFPLSPSMIRGSSTVVTDGRCEVENQTFAGLAGKWISFGVSLSDLQFAGQRFTRCSNVSRCDQFRFPCSHFL